MHTINNAGLVGSVLAGPRVVARLESQGAELLVSTVHMNRTQKRMSEEEGKKDCEQTASS